MQILFTTRARIGCCLLWCLSWPVLAVLLLTPLPFSFVSRTDLLGHFLLFAAMTIAIITFTRTKAQIIALSALTIAYGVALEFGQAYVPNRTFDAADALANIVGGIAGSLAALALLRLLKAPPDRKTVHSV